MSEKFIAETKTSSGGISLRIPLPKKAAETLNAKAGDIIGFYQEDGGVFVNKMS